MVHWRTVLPASWSPSIPIQVVMVEGHSDFGKMSSIFAQVLQPKEPIHIC